MRMGHPSSSILQLNAYYVCRLLTALFFPLPCLRDFSTCEVRGNISSIIAFPLESYHVFREYEPLNTLNWGVPLLLWALFVQLISYEES